MKNSFQITGILFIVLSLLNPSFNYGQGGQDVYDYEGARLVLNVDQQLDIGDTEYISYSKTFMLTTKEGNSMGEITATIEGSQKENFYEVELVTWGSESLAGEGGGIGYRTGIMPYSDDWTFRKDTQAIYGSGSDFQAALKDVEAKLNGIDGSISITGTGEPTTGDAVIIITKK